MIITGIYKITHIETGGSYIGLSVDIESRIKAHLRAVRRGEADKEYNKALYRAIRKYGGPDNFTENFKVEILETTRQPEKLAELEAKYIKKFNTYLDPNHYNETPGGEGFHDNSGEKHPNHKLTIEDVKDIRIRYAAMKESILDIYFDYEEKISYAGFKKIYTWQTWKTVLPELYTDEVRNFHKENAKIFYAQKGENNPRAKITRTEVIELRVRRLLGEPGKVIYESDPKYSKMFPNFRSFLNLTSPSSKTWPDTWDEVKQKVALIRNASSDEKTLDEFFNKFLVNEVY